MSAYVIHARAFHPDKKFGLGGLGFHGDNRGFSASLSSTSRIYAFGQVDFMTSTWTEFDVNSDPSTAPWFLGGTREEYIEAETKPEGHASFVSSPFAPNGMQTGNFQWNFRGINHAFTPNRAFNNLVVPYLDLSGTIVFAIDRDPDVLEMQITSTLRGDGFPNSEVFIIDSNDTPIMLNTHHRMGYAAGQLAYNAQHLLGGTLITVKINADGNFVGPIRATRCVDFMPEARDLLIEEEGFFRDTYRTDYSITQWNRLHTKRDPSEKNILGFDTDDSLPLPR
ncbi:hypothetical protein, partial [Tritonibacter multivorans]